VADGDRERIARHFQSQLAAVTGGLSGGHRPRRAFIHQGAVRRASCRRGGRRVSASIGRCPPA
jgi:hypothetical protein